MSPGDEPSVETLVRDAVTLIVTHAYGEQTPEQVRHLVAAETDMAECRMFSQSFGSTTGPFGGFGGQMITTFRVVAVKLGDWIVWHLNGQLAFVTAWNETTIEAWDNSQMPAHRAVLGAIPAWCPSRTRPPRPIPPERTNALVALQRAMSFSSMDWASAKDLAFLYGIVNGWGCDENHEHDDICGGDDSLLSVAEKYQLDIDLLRRLHADFLARMSAPAP